MKRSIGLLAPALLVLVAFSSQAATITNTYEVTASNFHPNLKFCPSAAPAPIDPLKVAFSISFDNGADITNSPANITLIALNMPHDGPLIYTYTKFLDQLSIGTGTIAGAVTVGVNNFRMQLNTISTNPAFSGASYSLSSPSAAAVCAWDSFSGAVTVGPPWTHVPFPMMGIRLAQSIRLNFVAGPVPVPGPGPCEALLNIYDAANNLVASQSVSPSGNVTFDYSLRSAIGGGRPALRKELRPEVIVMPGTPAAAACQAPTRATAEVYDDLTKSTSAVIPGIDAGPTQLPAVQFGPVGVGPLQTVRLSVVAFPPSPCLGRLSFTDLEGNPLRAPTPVRLTAGQSTFIDLPGTAVPSDSGHGEVMAAFAALAQAPGAAAGTCVPSVEVYDQLTGTTQVILSERDPGSAQ